MRSDLIASCRIASQHIGAAKLKTAGQVVGHMGAMQAQDFGMVRWAVALRSAGLTEKDVLGAYNKGEILRTHVLRPTWHLITNDDADWLIQLTAPRLLSALTTWNKKLNLTGSVYARSNKALEKAMAAGAITREAAVTALKAARPAFPPRSHTLLLFRAEVDRLIISGPLVDGEATYTLFDQRVKKRWDLPREEALARLAGRYFKSHGPASLADFTWWSGLKIGDARIAMESVRERFIAETVSGTEYFMASDLKPTQAGTHLLPAFDEFIIGYADREAALAKRHQAKVMTRNGLFRPIIVHRGLVIGTWSRELREAKLGFKSMFFGKTDNKTKANVTKAAGRLASFSGTN
jgi:hypothetical protein